MSAGVIAASAVTSTAGAAYPTAVLADAPWGYWRQQESSLSGTLQDSSGNARHLTLSGTAPTPGQPGPFVGEVSTSWPNSVGFGSGPSTTPPSRFTYEAWVYLTAAPGGSTDTWLVGFGGGGSAGTSALKITPSGTARLVEVIGSTVFFLDDTAPLALNAWHHLVASCGTAGGKLRVDKVTKATGGATNVDTSATSTAFTVRGGSGSGTAPLRLAEVAAWSGTQLSDTRTDAHYNAGLSA